MVRIVRRLSSTASTTPRRSPRIRVMSEASMAISVPVPRAMPTSAWARLGASLRPSPTMATRRPSAWSFLISRTLSPGLSSDMTLSMPAFAAMASAVRLLSPVSMTT